MKLPFPWLLAGLLVLLCAIAPARAQNTTLPSGIASLVRATDAIVALSNEGALSCSINNGVDFDAIRAADAPRSLYALGASGETVVAIGDASYFVRSTNSGLSYSALAPAVGPSGGAFRGIAAQSTTWVAVGDTGTNMAVLRSVDDGESWSFAASLPASHAGALNGVAWTGSRWLAVGTNDIGDGVILSSADGNTWTALAETLFIGLNAIASDGAGKVLVVGAEGTVLYATDGGATPGSFTEVGENIVSEDLRAVAFLSGDNWIIGGDSGVLVSFNGTVTGKVADADPATGGVPVTALLWTGSGANYFVSTPSELPPPAEPHGPISLQVAIVDGQLQLTLVGAEDGNSYHIESSATLATFAVVSGSTQAYAGGPAPTWNFPVPAEGGRIFYRAKVGAEP